jgi:hypothetical protein
MASTDRSAAQHVYVVTLHPPAAQGPGELSGRIEHVLSGRCHDFDSGAALLDCLAYEESELRRSQRAPAVAGGGG